MLTESINTNLVECFCWFANFVSHAILLEKITLSNGDNLPNVERSHTIFAYELWRTDISALDQLIKSSSHNRHQNRFGW